MVSKERYNRIKDDLSFKDKECIRRRTYHYKNNQRLYTGNRLKSDPCFKIAKVTRKRVVNALKTQLASKKVRTEELCGCSWQFLLNHIEKQFTEGMNWENHGFGIDKWNIDHIIPCISFDLHILSEQERCFHYSNLQPLWQIDNFKKGDRID